MACRGWQKLIVEPCGPGLEFGVHRGVLASHQGVCVGERQTHPRNGRPQGDDKGQKVRFVLSPPRGFKTLSVLHKTLHTLSIIAKMWKQPRCPSVGDG